MENTKTAQQEEEAMNKALPAETTLNWNVIDDDYHMVELYESGGLAYSVTGTLAEVVTSTWKAIRELRFEDAF